MKFTTVFKQLIIFALLLSVSSLYAQYVRQYQAIYPYNHGTVPTKVYAMTPSAATNSYSIATNPILNTSITGIGVIKLNNDLEIIDNKVYASGDYRTAHFTTMDIQTTSATGALIACGTMNYAVGITEAFIAKFDDQGAVEWAYTYPDATAFNSIVMYPNANTNPQYVVGGAIRNNGSSCVLMGISDMGYPVWAKYPGLQGANWESEFHELAVYKDPTNSNPRIVATGWIDRNITNITREVILTKIDFLGNLYYNKVYKHPLMTGHDRYYEEAYGIAVDDHGKYIYLTGPASNHNTYDLSRYYNDMFVYKIRSTDGALTYTYRYETMGSTGYETASSIKVKDTLVVVAGHNKGNLINPAVSGDAILFATNTQGSPLTLRIYGDNNTDVLTDLFENNENDGAIAIGFSSSWIQPSGSTLYSPYVVEAYKTYDEECHSIDTTLVNNLMYMDETNFSLLNFNARYEGRRLITVTADLDRLVQCAKVPTFSSGKADKRLAGTPVNDIRVYPSITSDQLSIEGLETKGTYRIYSVTGALVANGMLNGESNETLNVSDLNNGIYMIRIEAGNEAQTFKFVKR